MRLESISVKNFRSITKAEKLALRSPTVILGANNEGKSNLLRALVLAMEMLLDRNPRLPYAPRRRDSRPTGTRRFDWDRDFPVQLREVEPAPSTEFTLEFMLDEEETREFQRRFSSRLGGLLPIRITVNQSGRPRVTIAKQGPANATLARRAEEIAEFVAERLDIQYIGAVRTAEHSREVVASLVSRELASLDGDPEYEEALHKIAELRKPILARLGMALTKSLQEFLPDVKSVRLEIPEDPRRRGVLDSAIYVDDGHDTELGYKGDGMQSLAAIALAQHSTTKTKGRSMIVVIEEPESHLHPGAIHQLRDVVLRLGERHQVVISTHSPLFADRADPSHNIIVRDGKARPARSLAEVREELGVQLSDNLVNAHLVLVVEGDHDRDALVTILPSLRPEIGGALTGGLLAFQVTGGAPKLVYSLRELQREICRYFVFFDGDSEGASAVDSAKAAGLLSEADYSLARIPGSSESELEDFYAETLVLKVLGDQFAVGEAAFKKAPTKLKFGARARVAFANAGKPYSAHTERQLKRALADAVCAAPGTALDSRHLSVIANLADHLAALIADHA